MTACVLFKAIVCEGAPMYFFTQLLLITGCHCGISKGNLRFHAVGNNDLKDNHLINYLTFYFISWQGMM